MRTVFSSCLLYIPSYLLKRKTLAGSFAKFLRPFASCLFDNNSEEDIPIKKIDLTFHNTINSLTNEQRYNLMSILFFIAGFAKNTNMEKIVLQFIDSTAKEMGVIVEDSIQYAMLHNHNADLLVENVKYIMGLYPNVKKVFLKKCYELGKLTNNSEALMFSYTLSEECGVSKEDICK